MASSANRGGSAGGKPNQEQEIVQTFNKLRQEQRILVSKVAELEMDVNEHNLVVNVLKDTDPERKCFRMLGGVLVERTVKEVLPALVDNRNKIEMLVSNLESKVDEKGKELIEYRDKHNIKIRGEGTPSSANTDEPKETAAKTQSVLASS